MGTGKLRGCNSLFNSVSVAPDGALRACCGLYAEYIPEMKLGNLNNESLKDILKRHYEKEDAIKIALAVEGPEALLNYAHKHNPRIQVKDHYVHPCQSCLQIYKKKKHQEAIIKACKENEERFYSTYRIANTMDDFIMGRDTHNV